MILQPSSPARRRASGTSARSRSGRYALCIIVGVVVAIWIGERRWVARGGRAGAWSATSRSGRSRSGIVGAPDLPRDHRPAAVLRLPGGDPIEALYIWQGGLGIWGAIAGGALGASSAAAATACRSRRSPTRWRPGCWSPRPSAGSATGSTRSCSAARPRCRGAWRSTRRTGRPATTQFADASTRRSSTSCSGTSASPALVIWADRRFKLGRGRAFALYVMAYTLGRGWIEYAAHRPRPTTSWALRLNVWTSIWSSSGR